MHLPVMSAAHALHLSIRHDCVACGAPMADDGTRCSLCYRTAPGRVRLQPAVQTILRAMLNSTLRLGSADTADRVAADLLTGMGAAEVSHYDRESDTATYAITLYGRAVAIAL